MKPLGPFLRLVGFALTISIVVYIVINTIKSPGALEYIDISLGIISFVSTLIVLSIKEIKSLIRILKPTELNIEVREYLKGLKVDFSKKNLNLSPNTYTMTPRFKDPTKFLQSRNEKIDNFGTTSFIDVLLMERRVILFGGTGSGKTVSAQIIFAKLLEKFEKSPKFFRHKNILLPIFVDFRVLSQHHFNLTHYIRKQGPIKEILAQNKSLKLAIILDGLDDLPLNDIQEMASFRKSLVDMEDQDSYILITCRTEEYLNVRDIREMLLDYLPVAIKPLSYHQILYMLEKSGLKEPELLESILNLIGKNAKLMHNYMIQSNPLVKLTLKNLFIEKKDELSNLDIIGWDKWRELRDQPTNLLNLLRNPQLLEMYISILNNEISQISENNRAILNNQGQLFDHFARRLINKSIRKTSSYDLQIDHIIAGLADLADNIMHQNKDLSRDGILSQEISRSIVMERNILSDKEIATCISAGILQTSSAMSLSNSYVQKQGDTISFSHLMYYDLFLAKYLDSKRRLGAEAKKFWTSRKLGKNNRYNKVASLMLGLYNSEGDEAVKWLYNEAPEVVAEALEEKVTISDTLRSKIIRDWQARAYKEPLSSPYARASYARALSIINDRNYDNEIDIDWVPIQPGSCLFQNQIEIKVEQPFEMAAYPITYQQYKVFEREGYHNDDYWHGKLRGSQRRRGIQTFKWKTHPRECVNWFEASAFCKWLTAKYSDSWIISLPTEIQWEYAARASTKNLYPWGDAYAGVSEGRANVDERSRNVEPYYRLGKTSAVGIYKAGVSTYHGKEIYDLCGNVWEWTSSLYNISDIEDSLDAPRVAKGGSWYDDPYMATSTARNCVPPHLRNPFIGFRIVRSKKK